MWTAQRKSCPRPLRPGWRRAVLLTTFIRTHPCTVTCTPTPAATANAHAPRTAPKRPRHRPAQPAPAQDGAEPDPAGDRPACPRTAGLDALARPVRRNPQVGTPPPEAPPLLRRRPVRHDHPPPTPRFTRHWPWTDVITGAFERLDALPNPADQQIHLPAHTRGRPNPEQWNPASTRDGTRALDLFGLGHRKRNGPPTKSTARREVRGRPPQGTQEATCFTCQPGSGRPRMR
jgi:hypothetical protein